MDQLKFNPMYRYLMILGICAGAGLQGWTALFTNYAKEVVGVNGFQIGLSQAVREIPGFLSIAAVYLLFIFKEHRLSAWSVVLLGTGTAITGIFTSFGGLLMTTFIMSVGFHFFETTNKSLTVQYFNTTESPVVFARMQRLRSPGKYRSGIHYLGIIICLTVYVYISHSGNIHKPVRNKHAFCQSCKT